MSIGRSLRGLMVVGAGLFFSACGATSGPFAHVGRIEPELRRGVATKADVERVLGTPKGRGGTLLPGVTREREIWSYETIDAKNVRAVPRKAGGGTAVIHGDLQHQLLLVIFDGEVLDGFVWYTTGVAGEKSAAR